MTGGSLVGKIIGHGFPYTSGVGRWLIDAIVFYDSFHSSFSSCTLYYESYFLSDQIQDVYKSNRMLILSILSH